ncbi:MAG: hypothetical protein ACAH11_13890 [Sphingomonas sp.]
MSFTALALAAALNSADPAAENEKDLRCVALIAAIMPTADEEGKSALAGGMLYFIGRIEGREPNYDLRANFSRISKIPVSELQGDSDRCADIMTTKGELLMAIGRGE